MFYNKIGIIEMSNEEIKKFAKPFGKKEKVLNYASNTYQLTRPSKVDAVMALIVNSRQTDPPIHI